MPVSDSDGPMFTFGFDPEVKRNLETWIKNIEACKEQGEVFNGINRVVRHLGEQERFGSANGINYNKCKNCGLTYRTRWNGDDWKSFDEMMNTRITV